MIDFSVIGELYLSSRYDWDGKVDKELIDLSDFIEDLRILFSEIDLT